jgi:hypothetical protein
VTGELERARAAKSVLLDRLGGHPAVRGVGIARRASGYAVKLNLAEPKPRGLNIPKAVEGVPVVVEVVGRIAAQPDLRARRVR